MDRTNLEAILPLTPMQESLLFNTLRRRGEDPGFLQLECTLAGELDEASFRRAWQHVVQRHPALRASVHWEEVEKPLQVVYRRVELPWAVEDWRGLAPTEQEARLEGFRREDRSRGLELSRAPVMRVTLFRTAATEWTMVWSCHHVLLDGWSGALVLGEVSTIYEALRAGREPELPAVRPFRDFIAWLQRQDAAEPERYWRAALAGMTTPTRLPFDTGNGRMPAGVAELATHSIELPAAATSALYSLARRHRLTLNTIVQGAWAALLSARSGETDVCFGATVSGRSAPLPGIEGMVGLFINTLPVRIAVPRELSVASFLERLQEAQAGLRRFEHTALTQLQAWSEVSGARSLFESLVVFENFPAGEYETGAARRLHYRDLRGGITTGYPLTLVGIPGEALTLSLLHDWRRFAPADAARILEELREWLQRVVAEPDARVQDLIPATFDAGRAAARGPRPNGGTQPAVDAVVPVVRAGHVPARSALELQLAQIWESVLRIHPIGVQDDFFDLGGSSVGAAQLFSRIERVLRKRLPLATLFQAPTIELLARRLQDEGWTPPWSSLVAMQPDGARPPLFCVHSYEGDVMPYRALARRLAPDQPVYGLQAAGLDGTSQPLASVEAMAEHYLREIRSVQPHGPYYLLGLCFGISVALEVAQRLHAAGDEVGDLFILDSGFWTSVPRGRRAKRSAAERLRHAADELRRRWRHSIGRLYAGGERKRELFFEKVIEQAWWNYREKPYPGRVTLIRSSEFAGSPGKDWHLESWSRLAGGGVRSYVVPGAHAALLREPNVRELADRLRACMADASTAAV